MGRAELARALGLSTQAVSNIIAELEADGFLTEKGSTSRGRGLPAMQYAVNPDGGFAMGVEIRPDAILSALVDLNGDTKATRRHALKSHSPQHVMTRVAKMQSDLLDKTGVPLDKLMGVGVVIPGPFGQTGLSGLGSDLVGWQDLDVKAAFSTALHVPVEVSNDANAAAMSERFATDLHSFAYLYFGAGLGLGLVNQGQLVTGAFGNAGEIGHIPIATPSGPAPLEQHLSRVSIQQTLKSKIPLDIPAIEVLLDQQNKHFLRWLDQGALALSQAVAMIENMFDPQSVILGGAMPASVLDQLIARTPLSDLSVSHRQDNATPRLQRGECGRMTATLGAASLILNRAFTPQVASL